MVLATTLAVTSYIDRLLRALEPELQRRFGARTDASDVPDVPGSEGLSATFLAQTFRAVDNQAASDLGRVTGIPTTRVLPRAKQLERAWIRNNTELIQLPERARAEVRGVIEGPLKAGIRVEDVRAKLEERLGVVRSRAELIARDQTLKLYGQIQEARQTDAGIEEYTWSTSEDERVRSRHQALDGTTQRWDSPPIVDERTGRRAHPGGDFQCRCSAIPILPSSGIEEGSAPESGPVPIEPTPEFSPLPEEPRLEEPRVPESGPVPVSVPHAAPANDLTLPDPEAERLASEAHQAAERAAAAERALLEAEQTRLETERQAAEAARVAAEAPKPPPPQHLATFTPPEPKAKVTKLWRDESQRRYDSLNLIQKTAINAFVHSDYAILRALQQGQTAGEVFASGKHFASLDRIRELERQLPALRQAQRALGVSRPTQHGMLYRGLRLTRDQLDTLLGGTEMSFDASSNSTSYSYETARSFGSAFSGKHSVVLRILEVREGAFVGFRENSNRGETEVVVSNRTFRITGKTYVEDTDTYVVDLTETPESARRADEREAGLTQKVLKQTANEGRFWSDGSDITIR
jgi:SPP1 gp7 family putative phage head morphogenesis protein